MASNLLTPYCVDFKVNSDTLSDTSETGTASEWTSACGSREDLREFATRIGIEDINDIYQQRFRIDRKKLEDMLIGENEEPATNFFQKIMSETNTFISWPNKLKIGARTKKDPHIKVSGRPEEVQLAKERIMHILDTRGNRVTMKMDVSFTDHSHIIGKEGLTIKRVMEETRCHVHFPDSNRSNSNEKSNQVSIAGDIEGAERARCRVRNLAPLIFSFEYPISNSNLLVVPNMNTPYVAKIQQQYNVQVMFRTRPKLHATLVMVKGSEWEIQQLKQATCLLVEYMCENLSAQIPIQMSLEISPHHHSVVKGKNHLNIKAISQNTRTQIMFADAQDPNIPNIRKSNVLITGNIHNVYIARQQIVGSLPLLLIFDLPEDLEFSIDPAQLATIQLELDVTINIRHKAKQNVMACIIKGIERYANNIYAARNRVLGLKEQPLLADIPVSYFIPVLGGHPETAPLISVQPASPLITSSAWACFNQPPNFLGMPEHMGYNNNSLQHNSFGTSGYSSIGQYSTSSASNDSRREGSSCSPVSNSSPGPSPIASPRSLSSPFYPSQSSNESPGSELSCILSDESNASANYYSGKRESRNSPDFDRKRIEGVKAMQNRQISGYRVPTNIWSGYGISYTTPGSLKAPDYEQCESIWNKEDESLSSASLLNTSNILETTPTSVVNQITKSMWCDVPTMLTCLGLEKYIGVFVSHEIDLVTFQSLSEHDLIELGITAFGARRKMMLIISEMNKRSSFFAAAPGAERKLCPTSTQNGSPKSTWS